jgi:tryptophan halogenase
VSATWGYDLLVDPDLIAHYYHGLARKLGVAIVSDPVVRGTVDSQGFVKSIRLHGGGELDGDLFIDCSADRSIIASLADTADFDDWSPHLPCDRMISALTPKHGEARLYSATKALDDGWLEHVTLQQFDVTSLAYCSRDIDDANAKLLLEKNMKSAPISTSANRRWRSGSNRPQWVRNCEAIGPAAMAVEPLIASSLQIACNAILRLLGMLPASRDNPMLASEFNRIASQDHGGIRDYTLLYYQLARRPTSPFWSRLQETSLPQTLRRRMQHYASNGRLSVGENEGFSDAQWIATLINFGVLPASGDPLVEMAEPGRVRSTLQAFREAVRQAAETGNPR